MKLLRYSLLLFLVMIIATLISVWLLQDRIISGFIDRANTHLAAPVHVGDVELSVLRQFPLLSISLRDVKVEDSHPDAFTLLAAQRIDFSFNVLDAWNGRYEILALEVSGARLHIRYDSSGRPNFSVLKEDASSGTSELDFRLRQVLLNDLLVSYADAASGDQHQFRSDRLKAQVDHESGNYLIRSTGEVLFDKVSVEGVSFLHKRKFRIDLIMNADPETESVEFTRADLVQDEGAFRLSGYFDYGARRRMDLTLEADRTTIQAVRSLMPEYVSDRLAPYRSEGELGFTIRLSGAPADSLASGQPITLTAEFRCRDVRFEHQAEGLVIDKARFTGRFNAIALPERWMTELLLDSLTATLAGRPLQARVHVQDFEDPFIDMSLKGVFDAAWLSRVLSDSVLSDLSGSLDADVTVRGKAADLRSRKTADRVETGGRIGLADVSFRYPERNISFTGWNGWMELSGTDLTLKSLGGSIGDSDVECTGRLVNLMGFLIHHEQDVGMEAVLRSRHLDVNEIMAFGFGRDGNIQDASGVSYRFSINPRWHLRVDYEIGSLVYDRMRARRLSGELSVDRGRVSLSDARLRTMGGEISFDADIDASEPGGAVGLKSKISLDKIRIDSMFHVFHDFSQEFIQQRHLKGKATAEIRLDASFDEALRMDPAKLVVDADVLIREGELNDFEPMLGLKRFLDDDGLRRLRFADLRNEIHIRDQMVFIPKMEIRSNLTSIELAGRHGFDQRIDYHVVAPLTGKRRIDREKAGDALTTDASGKSRIYLKITGTTDRYDIAYDAAAVREKITGEIRKEVKSFKESFKSREKPDPKKQPKLSDEEFDWQEPQ